MEGYFQVGGVCNACETNCKTCVNFSNNCLHCKEGNYGHSCQYDCSHCKGGLCSKDRCTNGCEDGYYQGSVTCNPCNTHCTSCSTFQNCHACHDGYWGPYCQHTCVNCSQCNKDNGSCGQPTTTKSTTTPRIYTRSSPVTETVKTTRHIQVTSDPEMISEASSTVSDISQNKCTTDDNGLLYAAVIGWVLVVILISVVVVLSFVVYRYRVISNKGQSTALNVVATDRVLSSLDYTSLDMGTRREDENQYSMLQNPEPVVAIATTSTHNTGLQDIHVREITLPSRQHNGHDVDGHYMNT